MKNNQFCVSSYFKVTIVHGNYDAPCVMLGCWVSANFNVAWIDGQLVTVYYKWTKPLQRRGAHLKALSY